METIVPDVEPNLDPEENTKLVSTKVLNSMTENDESI